MTTIFKAGRATVAVYEKNGVIKKYFKTDSKFHREWSAYQILTDCDFVPKLLDYDASKKLLTFPYLGQSLNLRYKPKERYVFKPEIRKMNEILITCFGVHHNDIRWKNVVERDDGHLFLIDFEMWTPLNVGSKERDPEKILI